MPKSNISMMKAVRLEENTHAIEDRLQKLQTEMEDVAKHLNTHMSDVTTHLQQCGWPKVNEVYVNERLLMAATAMVEEVRRQLGYI